jgi:tetratricopeptide (TPR) repeat protein
MMLVGEYEDAITVLQKAIKHHERAELYYQLSNAYFNLKDEKNGQKMLEKALELDPSLSEDMEEKYPYIKDQVDKVKSKKK